MSTLFWVCCIAAIGLVSGCGGTSNTAPRPTDEEIKAFRGKPPPPEVLKKMAAAKKSSSGVAPGNGKR